MKKSIRILALVMVIAMGMMALASCDLFGKTVKGTYEAEYDGLFGSKYTTTYEFSGKNVTITQKSTGITGEVDTDTFEATYEIKEFDDGSMEITFDVDGGNDEIKDGTYTFEETEDYIVIGKTKYYKK